MNAQEMRSRTKAFALRVIRLHGALPKGAAAQVIGRQLLRCGTSVGANYRAACRARSRADFAARMVIVEEEADESAYWMELLVEASVVNERRLDPLLREASELTAIASASRMTARRARNRQSTIDNRPSRTIAP